MNEEALVSISEASRILGVSEPALRQWTDEGRVKAFITPGGHRRYSRAELKRFVLSHQKVLGLKDLAAGLEETVDLHRQIDRSYLTATEWFGKLGPEAQQQLSRLGRRLLDLVIRLASEPAKQGETIEAIRDVGRRFGETLAALGLPLTNAVQAFLQHRDPITHVTTQLMKKREGVNRRVVDAIPLVDRAMDEALVALVTAHQQHRNPGKGEGAA